MQKKGDPIARQSDALGSPQGPEQGIVNIAGRQASLCTSKLPQRRDQLLHIPKSNLHVAVANKRRRAPVRQQQSNQRAGWPEPLDAETQSEQKESIYRISQEVLHFTQNQLQLLEQRRRERMLKKRREHEEWVQRLVEGTKQHQQVLQQSQRGSVNRGGAIARQPDAKGGSTGTDEEVPNIAARQEVNQLTVTRGKSLPLELEPRTLDAFKSKPTRTGATIQELRVPVRQQQSNQRADARESLNADDEFDQQRETVHQEISQLQQRHQDELQQLMQEHLERMQQMRQGDREWVVQMLQKYM